MVAGNQVLTRPAPFLCAQTWTQTTFRGTNCANLNMIRLQVKGIQETQLRSFGSRPKVWANNAFPLRKFGERKDFTKSILADDARWRRSEDQWVPSIPNPKTRIVEQVVPDPEDEDLKAGKSPEAGKAKEEDLDRPLISDEKLD